MMNEITEMIGDLYSPKKAIVIYAKSDDSFYVEGYDFDRLGQPINAHPFSVSESQELADALDCSEELRENYLSENGLFPEKVLSINQRKGGFAIWYTPATKTILFFKAELGVSDGIACIPPLLWKADRESLSVWAIKGDGRPKETTPIFHAPFMNVYNNGSVCLGNVNAEIPNHCSIAKFIELWESYFFNSSFSHTMVDYARKKGKLVDLWKSLLESGEPFPEELLKPMKITIKDILL